MEIWKRCPSPNEDYEVSNEGRIRKGTYILKQIRVKNVPYLYANFYYPELKQNRLKLLAPLVCAAFHGPRPEGKQAMHIDENPTNNRADNLRWATQSENIKASYKNGQRKPTKFRRHPMTAAEYLEIHRLNLAGVSQVEIGKIVGCTNSAVSKILNGKVKFRKSSLCSDDAWLSARLAENCSKEQIAKLAGVTEWNVTCAIRRLERNLARK